MPGRFRRLCLLALLPAAALAACQPTPAEAPVAAVPEAEAATLPDCGALTEVELGPNGTADCRLTASGETGWSVEVNYSEGAEGAVDVSLKIAAVDGAEIQTIHETAQSAYGLPYFVDLDSDGRAELLVPLMTGNVNTSYAVWRGKEGDPEFVRTGEVSGIDVTAYEPGLFITPARSSASSWNTTYHVFEDNTVTRVATAEITLGETEDAPGSCTVVDDGGLAKIGLTLDAAQAKFCAAE